VPIRTCVVCREQSTKRQLVRIVRQPDDSVALDPSGRAKGRGAYLCDKAECWQRALETDALARALNTRRTDELRLILGNFIDQMTKSNTQSAK
jgi:predicted RNA-binding protein YlxR (DUF448 family)